MTTLVYICHRIVVHILKILTLTDFFPFLIIRLKMALMNGHGATACIFKDAGSTIILPRTLRNFEFISLLIISFLFMWPGLLNKTQMYYLSILLVLIIGSKLVT